MAIKEGAVDWFCNQCTKCKYYAGIEKEKPCTLEDPCMSREEFEEVKGALMDREE